jgi:spore coat polysaccharide biosynthesis protein SpsF
MSSTRLPGKVLEPILGTPMILREIERIRRASTLDGIVLATSTDVSDDPLVEAAQAAGVVVRRGPLDDVLARFLTVIDEFEPDTIVRLTGDNALADPAVIDLVVHGHAAAGAHYTSNVITRTFPRGLDVEVVSVAALRELVALQPTAAEREHVTLGIYQRPERFRMHNVAQSPDRSELRWTVDLAEDLAFARAVYAELYEANPEFGQGEILELLERRPELSRLESDAEH